MRRGDRRTPLVQTEIAEPSRQSITLLPRRLIGQFCEPESNGSSVHVPSVLVSGLQRVLRIRRCATGNSANGHCLFHRRPLLLDSRRECGVNPLGALGARDRESWTCVLVGRVRRGEFLRPRFRIHSGLRNTDRVMGSTCDASTGKVRMC